MSNPFDLNGKVIAITGASSGFGHHFAGVLAEHGATVLLGARREEKLAERVEQIQASGGKAQASKREMVNRVRIKPLTTDMVPRSFNGFPPF